MTESDLWKLHHFILHHNDGAAIARRIEKTEASLLDIKIELACRLLAQCRLCGHRCGINRLAGETGFCGLGADAFLMGSYVQIAEEPAINPSLMLALAGCGLDCIFCQQPENKQSSPANRVLLNPDLWNAINARGARSASFIGGNPDESFYAILKFLKAAPDGWKLPIVWNCHGYSSEETVELLNGVVDAFVPDFKYGCDLCAQQLSNAPGYPRVADLTVRMMLSQKAPVFVRMLILPGNVDCCHIPALDLLSRMDQDNLWISLRRQYNPENLRSYLITDLDRKPTSGEIRQVWDHARGVGLKLIEE